MTREELLPQSILDTIPPLYSNEGIPTGEIFPGIIHLAGHGMRDAR